MSDDQRPRDYWMCGHPAGCDEEPQWTPLTQPPPYCRAHDRRHERVSDLASRSGARAASIGKRGRGAPGMRSPR
jgi:hypothetical protein